MCGFGRGMHARHSAWSAASRGLSVSHAGWSRRSDARRRTGIKADFRRERLDLWRSSLRGCDAALVFGSRQLRCRKETSMWLSRRHASVFAFVMAGLAQPAVAMAEVELAKVG